MTPSPTTVQPSLQISGIQSAEIALILREPCSSVCGNSSTFSDSSLTAYLRDLARISDSDCFFAAMGRIQLEHRHG